MAKYGLGRGLSSLIAKKIQKDILPESSPVAEGLEDKIIQADTESISPNPHQPRRNFDHAELEDLANSIKEHGIIQPLIVTRLGDGRYQLIAGERRLRAAKMIGLKTVPVIARKAEKQQQLELSLLENIQRSNLNPIEEAVAYQRLINEFNLTQEELGVRLGKSRPVITNMLRLLTLPEVIQKAVIDGNITYSIARIIAGLPEYEQMKFFAKALKNKMTVEIAESEGHKFGTRRRSTPEKDASILALEEKLQGTLGTRVIIKKISSGGGEMVIHFYSEDELQEIMRKMGLM